MEASREATEPQKSGNSPGNWDPREGQQPFRTNLNGVGDRTTMLRRLLIGAGEIKLEPILPLLHTAVASLSLGLK